MLRAFFSNRQLQQLLREGKKGYDGLYSFSIILYVVVLPCILMTFSHYYTTLFNDFSPLQIYSMCVGGTVAAFILSQSFLWFFTTMFDFQEEKFLYSLGKTFFRFYNAALLVFMLPLLWYTMLPVLIFALYLPLLVILFCTFFIRFLSNINGRSRVYFFIYFCSLEVLPYLLLVKCITFIT
jgi:hypothetical protein